MKSLAYDDAIHDNDAAHDWIRVRLTFHEYIRRVQIQVKVQIQVLLMFLKGDLLPSEPVE